MTADQLRKKMEDINEFIMDAQMKIQGGEMVNLTSMDKDVATICTRAVALPPAQARDLQPLMAEMIGNLERLSSILKDYKDTLKS